MKIVNREEFLAIEHEVVYSKYEPIVFEELAIKVSPYSGNDWVMCGIADSISNTPYYNEKALLLDPEAVGRSISFDFEANMRDSSRSDHDLYAVWERDDVIQLINRLQRVVDSMPNPDCKGGYYTSIQGVFNRAVAEKLGINLSVIEDYTRVATECLKLNKFIKSEAFNTVNEDERLRLLNQRTHQLNEANTLLALVSDRTCRNILSSFLDEVMLS